MGINLSSNYGPKKAIQPFSELGKTGTKGRQLAGSVAKYFV